MSARHFVAQVAARDPVSMDEFGLRAPFGWQVAGLNLGRSELALSWPDVSLEGETLQLRIAVLDTREPLYRVEVRAANSSHVAGEFEIRWAAHFQIYEISIDADTAREGVVLRVVEGEKPLWILTGGNAKTPLPAALAPHLLPPDSTDKRAEFLARLGLLASVQCFGWMEGCVLDGLSDLAATHPGVTRAFERLLFARRRAVLRVLRALARRHARFRSARRRAHLWHRSDVAVRRALPRISRASGVANRARFLGWERRCAGRDSGRRSHVERRRLHGWLSARGAGEIAPGRSVGAAGFASNHGASRAAFRWRKFLSHAAAEWRGRF